MLQNRLFVALASRSGFGAAISDAIARSSIVFCNSVSADRIVVAASRLLVAAAACVILLGLLQLKIVNRIGVAASRLRDWFVIANFRNFGGSNCPFKIPFKKWLQNRLFVALASRYPVLELQFPTPLRVVLLCFATQSLQIAL